MSLGVIEHNTKSNRPVWFDLAKSSSAAPPHDEMALFNHASIESKGLERWKLGLDCSEIRLIQQPFVQVTFLLDNYKPTLEICL
jgi:hypothetical protein